MTPQQTFILYLLYGFFYVLMGVVILQQRNQQLSGFPLLKILPLVGLFGITHGISEWMTMAQISGLYLEIDSYIFAVKNMLKVFSFYFLLRFALLSLPGSSMDKGNETGIRRFVEKLPLLLLLAWFVRFGYLYATEGIHYLEANREGGVIIKRYLMSFPSGVIASIGLFIGGKRIQKMSYGNLHRWYYGLGFSIFVYGILDGFIVREMGFFPASVINNQNFFRLTNIPIQGLKIILGIVMTFSAVQISRVFEGEKKAVIDRMMKNRAVEMERQKMNREIHDRIIQKMYGAGLKIEAFLGRGNREYLQDANKDLQEGIREARGIISNTMISEYHPKDLESMIEEFVRSRKAEGEFDILFENRVPILHLGKVSKETVSQIYYILQEAVTNATKHSGASKILIRLAGAYDDLTMEVEDNGSGFNVEDHDNPPLARNGNGDAGEKLGIDIMKERAQEIGGKLSVTSNPGGTKIRLELKWGGEDHDRSA